MRGANVWTLDWLRLDPDHRTRDKYGVQWLLTEEKGFWGSPAPSVEMTKRVNRHGSFRPPGWKPHRTITLTGRCYASDRAVLRKAEARVLGLLHNTEEPGDLTCYTEFGALTTKVFLDGEILCTPLNVVSEPGIEFSLQLVAPDPRKYAVDWQSIDASLPSDLGQYGLDFEEVMVDGTGLYFGAGPSDGLFFGDGNSTGTMELRNTGTAPTYPIFTLYGPLDTPTISTGGSALTLNMVLVDSGDFVVIDPAAPSVLLGGTASRRHYLTVAQFSAFAVPPAVDPSTPGVLKVGFTHAGSPTAGGHLRAVYRPAWF